MKPFRIRICDLAIEEARPGVERRSFSTANATWIRYAYAPGSVFPVHGHASEQITIVLEGRIRFVVEGEEFLLAAGDALAIPAGAAHGAEVVGEERVVTDNFVTPRREGGIEIHEP